MQLRAEGLVPPWDVTGIFGDSLRTVLIVLVERPQISKHIRYKQHHHHQKVARMLQAQK